MSFPKYPAYKDSGVEWLGEIPEHWDSGSLRHLIKSVKNGTTLNQTTEADDTIAVSRIETISTGDINFDKVGYVPLIDVAEHFLLIDGDILFSHINSLAMIGNAAMYRGGQPLVHGMNLLCIRPSPEVSNKWLFYWLISKNIRQEIRSRAKPAINQASISIDSVRSLPAVIPPSSEQAQIADFLDHETAKIDALIEEQQRLIELLKEKRQAVISHAVTKGMVPNVPMKDSGVEWLGEVPTHWSICKLNFRYSIELGKMLDEKKITGKYLIPYLRNQDVQWGAINAVDLPEMDIAPREFDRYTVRLGDLLVCEGGEVGRAAIWQRDDCVIGYQKALHRLRPRTVSMDTAEFLFFSLMAAKFNGVFEEADTKATISHLPAEKFRQYIFAFPPMDEQTAIALFLKQALKQANTVIDEAFQSIQLLKERRSALISAAVTGKIDVRNWQPPSSSVSTQQESTMEAA